MAAIIEETNTITAKSQTRVPKVLRPALDVACGGKIAYRIEKDRVTVHNPEAEHHEPTLAALLGLIEKNIEAGRDVRDRSGTGSFQGCRSSLALYIQGLTCWARQYLQAQRGHLISGQDSDGSDPCVQIWQQPSCSHPGRACLREYRHRS
jgi:prlF antitoxin for toxin YhaV_toxin